MALPRGATGLSRFVIVVFPDHTHLLFLIKVKLFSALVFTIISYIITDYHNLADEGVRCSYKRRIYYITHVLSWKAFFKILAPAQTMKITPLPEV